MKEKALVIGANSSLGKNLIKVMGKKNVIFKTFSMKKKLNRKEFNLNLNNENSILNFVRDINKIKFKYLIFVQVKFSANL